MTTHFFTDKNVIEQIYNRSIYFGLLGLFTGQLAALNAHQEPKYIGPYYAFAYLSFLYSLIIKVLIGLALPNPTSANSNQLSGNKTLGIATISLLGIVWSLQFLMWIFAQTN